MNKPTVIMVGSPDWADDARENITQAGYQLQTVDEREGYLQTLVDVHAALVLVAAQHPDWEHFATSPKVNSATRRIPVVAVTADEARTQRAYTVGVDLVLRPGDIKERIGVVLNEYSRVQPADAVEQLAAQCAEPLPALARQGIEQFNNGAYYRQHDSFEELWMEETGPVRDLYRAILQVGIAYYQVQRGNARGALKMLLRAEQWLNILPDACQGVDVARLRADAGRLRAALNELPEDADDLSDIEQNLLGKVHFVDED